MLQGKHTRRMVAATLLTILLTDTFAPAVAYALTSGPTQPEATSFEPVDTTDMVNLQTGDLTYNVPLIEVPGPEGGYPLSLSYHAGIQTNEDASWVGLGWTLNPGAITRNVNGYPDDWQASSSSSHVYWNGGSTTTYSVGLNVGIANTPATVGFGLSFSQDTYRGFGVGFNATLGGGIQLGAFDANASIGITGSPYGDVSFGGSVGFGLGGSAHGLSGSLGMNISTNFESVNAGFAGGLGYGIKNPSGGMGLKASLLGASISTGGGKPSLSLGGLTSAVSNSNAGKVSTSSHGAHVDIPIWYGINLSLGYNKTRYWTDETTAVTTHGSLYSSGYAITDNVAYDEYALPEDPSYKNIVDYPDPTVVQGGSFPDFDVYNVNAQGLAGSMRPYLFQGGILNQNIKNVSTPLVNYFSPGVTNSTPFFRFENDFSNSYRQNYPAYPDPSLNLRFVVPPMDGSPVYGNNDGTYGYGFGNALAGSKHVDVGVKVHPVNALGYNSSDRLQSGMIEGFSITNESGVTYHFGLPAYSYQEENYQQNVTYNNGYSYNRLTRTAPYAYTWYLTTITGPDFVDRDGDGKAGAGDWGYWVNFEYGKWSNKYIWRNPSEEYKMDEDNQFKDCSIGYKEVYYLNAIRTRTHVALFEKDLRKDGKGESPLVFNKGNANVPPGSNAASSDYQYNGLFDVNSSQSLQLSRIYLLNAADENLVTASSGTANLYTPARSIPCPDCELPNNVLDRTDVDALGRTVLEAKAIRIVDLKYDYSLCPNTTNSFDSYGTGSSAVKSGKLTLKNLVMRGKGGSNLLPPTSFEYDLTGTEKNVQPATISGYTIATANNAYSVGDLIMQSGPSGSPDIFLGVIYSVTGGGPYTYSLENGAYTASPVSGTVYATKNPPYDMNAFDMWGLYKEDYGIAIGVNENIARFTSDISAKSVDAWSLRTITTPLGSQVKMKYESDTYKQSALDNRYSFIMSNILSSDRQTLTFNLETYSSSEDPSTIAPIGTKFNPVMLLVDYGNAHKITQTNLGNLTITGYNPHPTGFNGAFTGVLDVAFPASNAGGSYDKVSTGNVYKSINTDFYGGGIRVASLSINNATDNSVTMTSYNYNDLTGRSSGITSYLPTELDTYDASSANNVPPGLSYPNLTQEVKNYRVALYANASRVYSLARELPPPGVMYQYVTVTDRVQTPDEPAMRDVMGSTQYQFEVFNTNMVGIADVTPRTQATNSFGTFRSRNMALQKFTGGIGNLIRSIQYDANGKILSETINHYLHDPYRNASFSDFMTGYKSALAQYYYQGYLQERYSEIKEVTNQPISTDNAVLATLSAREEYPCIQTGQTVINYVNGTQSSSQNLGFDFYSGAVTQTLETDAYGNSFMTQVVPAYRQYTLPYPSVSMGLKINNDNNLNMLTQKAATYMWKVDGSNNKLGLVSAAINTWSNAVLAMGVDGNVHVQNGQSEGSLPNGNVWRLQSTYNWMPTNQTSDGLTPFASFTDFNWSNPSSTDARWVKTSDITMYDVYSNAVEARDINNNYATTHLSYGEQKVILTGGPANYYEIAYSGAEDAAVAQTSGAFVEAADGSVAPGVSHTGVYSLLLGTSGKRGFLYSAPIVAPSGNGGVVQGRSYTASVWVKPASGVVSGVKLYYSVGGTVKGSSLASSKTAGGWTLLNLPISGSDLATVGQTFSVWCQNDNTSVQAYVDDMRFQPLNAATTAYVYDPFSGELTHILDNSNIYTRFEYDASGRLVKTYKEKLGIGEFKTNQYQYNYSAPKFTNAAINQSYTKNNCPMFYNGSLETANIPASTYISFISQADADAQAGIYAQDYANTHGTCGCAPQFTFAGGISSVTAELIPSGTRENFTWVFTWPSGSTNIDVGQISGSCTYPTATRTIPVMVGTSVYNVIVSPTGDVRAQWVSGPTTTGVVGLSGVYDLNSDLFYSAQESGTYVTNCPFGYIGTSVTYTVPAYKYAATDQTTANNLAIAEVQANGQNNANNIGTCNVSCSFSWASGVSSTYTANVSTNGSTVSFDFVFGSPSSSYTGGSLGTITGGCHPSTTITFGVTDGITAGRTWNVTVTPAGSVSVILTSGGSVDLNGPPIEITGSFNL